MVRALGLKINRIVIDAGHGGHDSGTLGPGGIQEKDVVLDVALRLGRLLKQRLGADVIYTRSDDTFIPLETRTAIANQAQADSSSPFTPIPVLTRREGSRLLPQLHLVRRCPGSGCSRKCFSDESIHQLSDLVKKIALQDKINESRAFADDVDSSLYAGLDQGNPGLKDRGVKKAPLSSSSAPTCLRSLPKFPSSLILTTPKSCTSLNTASALPSRSIAGISVRLQPQRSARSPGHGPPASTE